MTFDGKPLSDAEVRFVPISDVNLGTLVSKTDREGKFQITRDAANNSARPGTYGVSISKTTEVPASDGGMTAPKDEIPELTRALQEKPIQVEVKPGVNALDPLNFGKSK